MMSLTLIDPDKTERHSFERRMASVDERKKQQVTVNGSGCGTSATPNIRTRPNCGPRDNRQRVSNVDGRGGEGQSKTRQALCRLAGPKRVLSYDLRIPIEL
jgi:hypothetical protein